MSNPLEYRPIPVKEYNYDPWETPSMKRQRIKYEEKKMQLESQKQEIRTMFKKMTQKYDHELLNKIWKEEFTPRDLIAEFEDRQYL